MFSFFKKKPPTDSVTASTPPAPALVVPATPAVDEPTAAPRTSWLDKLKAGLRKTGSSIATVFTGTQIDDALYEELEAALLMADAGTAATAHLLADLKQRVKDSKATDPAAVKGLLAESLTALTDALQAAAPGETVHFVACLLTDTSRQAVIDHAIATADREVVATVTVLEVTPDHARRVNAERADSDRGAIPVEQLEHLIDAWQQPEAGSPGVVTIIA